TPIAHMNERDTSARDLDAIDHTAPHICFRGSLATRHATHTFLLLVRPHPKFLRAQAHDVPCLGLNHQCRVQEKAAMFFQPQWTKAFALVLVSVVEFRRVSS